MLAIVHTLLCCDKERPAELMLLDFESESELEQLDWHCHTLYSLSADHATHGSRSLKLELFPSEYPGLVFSPPIRDWRGYKALHFDVYNPSAQRIQLSMRLDDKKKYPGDADVYNESIMINPGANHIAKSLAALETTGTKRHMDLANIQLMLLYEVNPQKKSVLFIDAIKLR
jgi:hypothetical protein